MTNHGPLILINHDARIDNVVGTTEMVNGKVRVTINDKHALSDTALFDVFGNAGVNILRRIERPGYPGESLIAQFEIREWSIK